MHRGLTCFKARLRSLILVLADHLLLVQKDSHNDVSYM
jgi:hypothetical protein